MTETVPESAAEAAVVDANGQRIATVATVDDGVPYVEPRDDIDATAQRALDWHRDSPPHRLRSAHVETVDEDRIRLKGNL